MITRRPFAGCSRDSSKCVGGLGYLIYLIAWDLISVGFSVYHRRLWLLHVGQWGIFTMAFLDYAGQRWYELRYFSC